MPLDGTILNRRILLWALFLGLTAIRSIPGHAKSNGDGGGDGDGRGGRDDRGDDHSGRNDDDSRDDDRDKDAIRNAVRKGEAAPLRDILSMVRNTYQGEVVRIRLTKRKGNFVYFIRMIDPKNRVVDIRVNAQTRQIMDVKGF